MINIPQFLYIFQIYIIYYFGIKLNFINVLYIYKSLNLKNETHQNVKM